MNDGDWTTVLSSSSRKKPNTINNKNKNDNNRALKLTKNNTNIHNNNGSNDRKTVNQLVNGTQTNSILSSNTDSSYAALFDRDDYVNKTKEPTLDKKSRNENDKDHVFDLKKINTQHSEKYFSNFSYSSVAPDNNKKNTNVPVNSANTRKNTNRIFLKNDYSDDKENSNQKVDHNDDNHSQCSSLPGTTTTNATYSHLVEPTCFWDNQVFVCPFKTCPSARSIITTTCSLFDIRNKNAKNDSIPKHDNKISSIDENTLSKMIMSLEINNDRLVTTHPKKTLLHLKAAHHLQIENVHEILGCFNEYVQIYADKWNPDDCHHDNEKPNNDDPLIQQIRLMVEEEDHEEEKSNHVSKIMRQFFVIGHKDHTSDQALRQSLVNKKLELILKRQEQDRQLLDDPQCMRSCVFCHKEFQTRYLFKHMLTVHSFKAGQPISLVKIDPFLSTLESKLSQLQCIYCERVYKDVPTLKKHMKTRKHYKISYHCGYDEYYIVNYVYENLVKKRIKAQEYNSELLQEELEDENDSDIDWEDWNDEQIGEPTMCLFDNQVFPSVQEAYDHMSKEHGFSLEILARERKLNFYDLIRLINLIRRQTSLQTCFSCSKTFDSLVDLKSHLDELKGHVLDIPCKEDSFWKDPSFLFPTFENDPLLFHLDFNDDDDGDGHDEDKEDVYDGDNFGTGDRRGQNDNVHVMAPNHTLTSIDSMPVFDPKILKDLTKMSLEEKLKWFENR